MKKSVFMIILSRILIGELIMAIDNDTVRQIAYLARLGVEEDKLEETQREFNRYKRRSPNGFSLQ